MFTDLTKSWTVKPKGLPSLQTRLRFTQVITWGHCQRTHAGTLYNYFWQNGLVSSPFQFLLQPPGCQGVDKYSAIFWVCFTICQQSGPISRPFAAFIIVSRLSHELINFRLFFLSSIHDLKVVVRINWFCAIFCPHYSLCHEKRLHFGAIFVPATISSVREEILHRKRRPHPGGNFGAGSPPWSLWREGTRCLPLRIPCHDFRDRGKQTKSRTPLQELLFALFPPLLWGREHSTGLKL